jgi:hypothetical protein
MISKGKSLDGYTGGDDDGKYYRKNKGIQQFEPLFK